jgi:polyphosphate kinase 2 (PPK2 family)
LPARAKTRKAHKTAVEELRAQLVQAQVDHRGSDFPVIIMIAGFDAAGKGEVIQRIFIWIRRLR